jgi:Reverse transcriptase (RNA-dependent DNA polymerase).
MLLDNSLSNNTTFSEWDKIKHSVPKGLVLGPLFFLLYINDLLNLTADLSKPVLFADDTSMIITNPSPNLKKTLTI